MEELKLYLDRRAAVLQAALAAPEVSGTPADKSIDWSVDPDGRNIFKAGRASEVIFESV